MVNWIWLAMLVTGIITAAVNGNIELITQSALDAATSAVELCLKLLGVMSLWLGVMKIAERSGLITLFTKLIRPITRFLFPSLPKQHPAMGAIMMTISANLLGLGNAATPLGMKAMQHLQELNDKKDTASEAMCTFLALCTAGFTLIPATIIALRAAAGSTEPTAIVGSTLLASATAMVSVVIVDKICRMVFRRRGR